MHRLGAGAPTGVRASLDALAAPRDGRGGFSPFRNVRGIRGLGPIGALKRPKIEGASSIFSAGRREMMLGPRQQLRVGVARAGQRRGGRPMNPVTMHPTTTQ